MNTQIQRFKTFVFNYHFLTPNNQFTKKKNTMRIIKFCEKNSECFLFTSDIQTIFLYPI